MIIIHKVLGDEKYIRKLDIRMLMDAIMNKCANNMELSS